MTSLKVCKYFIKSSPVGELHEVLDDIGKVLGSQDFLSTPEIKDALRDYYETHKLHVTFSDGRTAVVAPMGRQEALVKHIPVEGGHAAEHKPAPKKVGLFEGDDEYGAEKQEEQPEEQPPVEEQPPQTQEVVEEFVYYDPNKKLKFSFNPVTLEARIEEENVDWETQYLPTNVVQLRDDIVKAMNTYLSTQYRKGTSEFAVYSEGDGSKLKVEISCHNLNFKNYWGGEWSSTWTIDVNNGAAVSGHIRVHNHYFEQGNIQFNLEKDIASQKPK
jgi:hypothetical protein